MRDFFSENLIGEGIQTFSLSHLQIIFITFSVIGLIFIFRKQLKDYQHKELIAKVFVTILFLNMLIYYIGRLITNQWTILSDLPFQYCFISGYLFMYMIWFKKEKIFNFLYFGIFICTMIVIIWQKPLALTQYKLYHSVISHHFLLISLMYTLAVLEYKVDFSGYYKSFVYSSLVFLFAMSVNKLIGSNYMFSTTFPDYMFNLYPFLKDINYPFIFMIIVGLVFGLVAYIPVNKINENCKHLST